MPSKRSRTFTCSCERISRKHKRIYRNEIKKPSPTAMTFFREQVGSASSIRIHHGFVASAAEIVIFAMAPPACSNASKPELVAA